MRVGVVSAHMDSRQKAQKALESLRPQERRKKRVEIPTTGPLAPVSRRPRGDQD